MMYSFKYLLLAVIQLEFYIQVQCGNHTTFSWNYEYRLDLSEGRYTMYWNSVNSDDELCFAINVQTTGWVGFGFSPNGDMAQSDVVMGWVNASEVTFHDRWAEVRGVEPTIDAIQNYRLISGEEVLGNTSFEFCRKPLTCDEFDREIISGTTRVIFSWNDEDPNPTPLAHSVETRGTRSVNLLNYNTLQGTDPSDLEYTDFLSENYTIPSVDTTYYCIVFPYPQTATKRHVIRHSSVLSPQTKNYVHHFLIYFCSGNYPNIRGLCDSSALSAVNCYSQLAVAWAVGGQEFNFPPEVGYPIGPSEPLTNVLLEIHYNNPGLDEGLIDNSGIRLYHTGQLRTYDAGLLTLGNRVTPSMMIPPQASRFTIQAYCPKECTSMLPHNISVIASILHTHLVGVAIWTQIIRDGKEIGYLDSNLNYDFNFQDFIVNKEPIIIQPGDELIVNCQYKTEGRTDYTIGGESTSEEMCFHFAYYYPRASLETCISQYNLNVAYSTAIETLTCNNIISNGTDLLDASKVPWSQDSRIFTTLEESPQKEDSVTVFCEFRNSPIGIYNLGLPIPDVNYTRFPYTTDRCGNSNSTYYLRNEVYTCATDPTASATTIDATTSAPDPTSSACQFSRINLITLLMAIIAVILSYV